MIKTTLLFAFTKFNVCVWMGRRQTERSGRENATNARSNRCSTDRRIHLFRLFSSSFAFCIRSPSVESTVPRDSQSYPSAFFFSFSLGVLSLYSFFHFPMSPVAIIFFDISFLSSSPFRLISEYGLFMSCWERARARVCLWMLLYVIARSIQKDHKSNSHSDWCEWPEEHRKRTHACPDRSVRKFLGFGEDRSSACPINMNMKNKFANEPESGANRN